MESMKTDKQEIFIDQYCLHGNAAKAAEMAGIEPISNPAAPVTVQVHDLPHTAQPPASSRQIETPIDWMLLREENPTI